MKKAAFLILATYVCGIAGAAGAAKSFLTANSFPKTFDDVSFVERAQVLAEGYEPFETEFDENGRCVSGCPYQGFTLEDQVAQIERNKQMSQRLLERAQAISPEQRQQPAIAPQPQQQTWHQQLPQTQQQQPVYTTAPSNGARHCSVFLDENRQGTQSPRGEPLANCPRISSRYGLRTHPVTGVKNKMHNGVDLPVPIGTDVYATGDGVVIKTVTNPNADACGKYVKIQHPNGMISVYCHLSEILVKQNESVQSGCLIAKSGNTGRSTGPHLHYSVRLSNNEGVDPEAWMTCTHKH